jgi:NADH dehydrogenase [ubiquinone] 1 alpha subcomplex assembly factor 1
MLLNRAVSFLLILTTTSVAVAENGNRLLFNFKNGVASKQWRTVNDGVMGGRSNGRFRINNDKSLEFFGTLSLENNGGFASVRSRGVTMNLKATDSIVMKVRGDGREYSLNLYTAERRMAFSYRAKFKTKKNEWTEISIPLSKFVATSFGRVLRGQSLNPNQINSLGIMLGDKKAGTFKLEIGNVSVTRGDTVTVSK